LVGVANEIEGYLLFLEPLTFLTVLSRGWDFSLVLTLGSKLTCTESLIPLAISLSLLRLEILLACLAF